MKIKLICLVLATAGLSACGGGGGALTATGNAQGQLVGTQNAQAVQQLASLLSADVTTPQSLGFNVPTFVSPYDGCRNYVIGSSTADKHYKIKFNCRNIVDGSETMNLLGTYEFEAEDATDTSKGYRQAFNMTRENVGNISDVFEGFDEFKKTATQAIFESDLTVKMKMANHKPAVDWEWRRAFKTVYTPDDMTDPLESGKMSIQGHLGISGQIGGDSKGKDLGITKLTFEVFSTDVVYDKTCTNFKSGTVTFKDGAGNSLVYTHSCNSVTTKWNGQAFTW